MSDDVDPRQILFSILEEQNDKQHMMNEVYRNQISSMLDEMSLDSMVAFRFLMHQMGSDTSGRYGAYYEGIAASYLRLKFSVCGGCGESHSDIASLFDGVPEDNSEPEPISDGRIAESEMLDDGSEQPSIFTEGMVREGEYDIGELLAFEVGTKQGSAEVVCMNCGLTFTNLAERMAYLADSCPGCINKAKWG